MNTYRHFPNFKLLLRAPALLLSIQKYNSLHLPFILFRSHHRSVSELFVRGKTGGENSLKKNFGFNECGLVNLSYKQK